MSGGSLEQGSAAAAAMFALRQNHQISITAPAANRTGGGTALSSGQQQSLLLSNQPQQSVLAKRPNAASGKIVFDYSHPRLYRELLTDAKLNFIKRHIEFLEQYQNMRCICCPKDFPTYKLFMAHMRKKYDTLSRNLCFKCLRQFETKSLFIGHLKKKNCINLYRVYLADDTISKKPLSPVASTPTLSNSLKAGTKEIIANKVYGCKLCDKTFRLKADFRSHVQLTHADEPRRDGADAHGCAYCPIEFEDSAARKRHLNNLDCIVFLICGTCDSKFETLAMYIDHVYADHLPAAAAAAAASAASSIPVEMSPTAGRSVMDDTSDVGGGGSGQRHSIDTDTGEVLDSSSGELDANSRVRNPSHCLVCNKMYNNYYNMLRHMESKHPDQMPRTYHCQEEGCTTGYARQSELREHMFQVHGIALPKTKREYFTCRLCGTVFDQRDAWLDHQQQAHQRFYCNLCDVETAERSELEAHLRNQHGASVVRGNGGGSASLAASRANQCTICEHSFNSERGLETHLAVVHGMKRAQMPQRVVKRDELGEDDGEVKIGNGADGERDRQMAKEAQALARAIAMASSSAAAAPAPRPAKRYRPIAPAVSGAAVSLYRKCRLCGETFNGGVALANHMRTHGIMSIRPGSNAVGMARAPAHGGAHSGGGGSGGGIGGAISAKSKVISRMRCRICQKRIHTKTSYKRHMLNIHGVNDCVFIKCTVCPAEFSNDKGLKVHMFRTHNITVQQMQLDESLRPIPQQESTSPGSSMAATSTPNTSKAMAMQQQRGGGNAAVSKEFECNFCHTVYRSRELLAAHQKSVHGAQAAAMQMSVVDPTVVVKDEPQSEDDVEMIGDDDDDGGMQHAHQLLGLGNAAALAAAANDPNECWWQCRYCDEVRIIKKNRNHLAPLFIQFID